ncbi:hypothetical protein HDK77DRAFT_289805 [Phyllosticta capitalensis]|uniref:Uncharacterized protein n=1 Tax=Phyllosticta capitalensis TaxID=121624 RepID=A0ABR1YFS3_9PEZI
MLRWYQSMLAKRPLLTQSVTTAVLFGTGDVLAQQAVEKRGFEKHEWIRTARMAGYGGAVFGPAATTWFKVLSRVQLSNPFATTVTRVAADQLLFAPTSMFVFLSSMSILEGTDPRKKLEAAYKPALIKNWMVWPFVQMGNFTLVPLEHRVLVVNIVSLGWNCYLSWLNSQGGTAADGVEAGSLAAEKTE